MILFRNTTIHLRNSGRWLETRFFNTPVVRARLERRRRDMALVLHVRPASQGVTPNVHSEAAPGGGFHYIYIDFPPGEYAPVVNTLPQGSATIRPADGPPSAPAREEDPSLRAMDGERPPGQ